MLEQQRPGQVNILQVNENSYFSQFSKSVEVRTVSNQGGDYNHIYFDEDKLSSIVNVDIGDKVIGGGIPDDTIVSQKDYDRITLSNNVVVSAEALVKELNSWIFNRQL